MIEDFCQSGTGGGDERRLDSESILKEESTIFPDSLCGKEKVLSMKIGRFVFVYI